MNRSSPYRRVIPDPMDDGHAMSEMREHAHEVAEADPSRSSAQKLAVERGVMDAYRETLRNSPRGVSNTVVVESMGAADYSRTVSAPAKKKKKATATPNKTRGMGKLDAFRLQEREREYDQKNAELERKMDEAKKVSQMQVLQKQKHDLERDYCDVIFARQKTVQV